MDRQLAAPTALVFFVALFFGLGSAHAGTVVEKDIIYGELFQVTDIEMVDNDVAHNHFSYRRRLPMGRELTFRAVGADFDYKVALMLDLVEVFGHKAKVYGALANGVQAHDRSYHGSGSVEKCTKAGDCTYHGEVEKTSVTFFEAFGEHVFHALIRLDKEEFAVDPKRLVDKEKFTNGRSFPATDSPLTEMEPDMYFYSSSTHYEKEEDAETGMVTFTPQRRQLLQTINKFTNCYSGQGTAIYKIGMGMLIDDGFYAVTGGNSAAVRDYVAGMMNDMNTMYRNQMDVEIALQELVLGDTGDDTTGFTGNTFNEAPTNPGQKTCPSGKQPSTRLNELRQWRGQNQANNLGLWHLMTHCHPPSGTVGIAYVGALCQSYGVGLSNYLGSSTWEVLAHEVGHNFGSGHTFDRGVAGGIMDYGDGLLEGIYQFHPVHKNEVCAEISGSMTQRRTIAACWTSAEANPAPVTAPTPRPVAPTPQPVAPTPRPTTQAQTPTERPTATPRPTLRPTAKPLVETGSVFQWQEVVPTEYGACSVSCGGGFQTKAVECRRVEIGGAGCAVTPQDINTAQCSETSGLDFSGCTTTTVANNRCQLGCKPTTVTRTCGSQSCGGSACGNGVLNKDEYCDPAIGPDGACCVNNCQSWSTATDCVGKNRVVDAAVMDYDQRLYIFQGNQFAVYEDMDDAVPVDGYPKPLTTIENLAVSFQTGIDSAASLYDDYVLLFKGLDFVIVDVGELAQLGGVRSATSLMSLDQQVGTNHFIQKGRIDAILSYYWTMDLVVDDLTAEFNWYGYSTGASELVNDRWSMEWPVTVAPGQTTAAVRNPVTGKTRFYQGSFRSEWEEGSGTPTVSQSPPIAGRDEAACLVDDCATCNASDNSKCTTCNTGFRRKRRGRLCKPRRNFIDLSFDDNDYSDAFLNYAVGHEAASADNGGWPLNGEIVDGAFGYGLKLNGKSMRLQPHDFGGPVSSWKVSFMWWPEHLGKQRALTILRDRGLGFHEKFTVDFVSESETEPIAADQFAIEVWMYDTRVDCYVDKPIKLGQWNKISLEFGVGYVITAANGVKHHLKMETGETDDYTVEFLDWYIGEDDNSVEGLSGTIDKFEVANLDVGAGAVESGSKPAWMVAVIACSCAIAGIILIAITYHCFCKPKWCTPELNEHLTAEPPAVPATSMLPRAPTPSYEAEEVDSDTGGQIQQAPPPRGRKAPKRPPPPRRSGLDLGLTSAKRRDSWNI